MLTLPASFEVLLPSPPPPNLSLSISISACHAVYSAVLIGHYEQNCWVGAALFPPFYLNFKIYND